MIVLLGWIGHTDRGGSCGTTTAYRIWRDGERLSFNALEAQLQTHVELSRVVSTLVSCMR
jgi:hypothetical protein